MVIATIMSLHFLTVKAGEVTIHHELLLLTIAVVFAVVRREG